MKWIVTKLLAHNCFLGTKEKNNYAVEKKKAKHLNQEIKINITKQWQTDKMCLQGQYPASTIHKNV